MSHFSKTSSSETSSSDIFNPYAISPYDPRPREAHYALPDGRPYAGPMNHQFTPVNAMYTGAKYDYTSEKLRLLPHPVPLDYSVPEPESAPELLRTELTVFAPGYGIPEVTLMDDPNLKREAPFLTQRLSMNYNPGFQGAQSIPPSTMDPKQLIADPLGEENPKFIVQRIGAGRQIFNPMAPAAKPAIKLPEVTAAGGVKIDPNDPAAVAAAQIAAASTPADSEMTITGVPVVQNNPNPSPFIFHSDPSVDKAISEAQRLRIEEIRAKTQHLKTLVPAFMQARQGFIADQVSPNMTPVQLTALGESIRKQLRAEFVRTYNIGVDQKNIMFIELATVRSAIAIEVKRQDQEGLKRYEASAMIATVFRGRRSRASPAAPASPAVAGSSTAPPSTPSNVVRVLPQSASKSGKSPAAAQSPAPVQSPAPAKGLARKQGSGKKAAP